MYRLYKLVIIHFTTQSGWGGGGAIKTLGKISIGTTVKQYLGVPYYVHCKFINCKSKAGLNFYEKKN
jgi:hypothetical protein